MISFLHGVIREYSDQLVVLEVGGIGFSIMVPSGESYKIHQKIELSIYMHWTQDQGPVLFGFESPQDKTAFTHIISCPGIGPKLGMAVLRSFPASTFFAAILTGDIKALSSVSGLGTKKAETLIIHLKDKIAKLAQEGAINSINSQAHHLLEVSQALLALQYTRSEVASVIQLLQKEQVIEKISFDELMRKALALISKKKV